MDEVLPVAYPLPASHVLSPLSPVRHPHRAGYVPTDGGLPADVLDCAQTRLCVESWRTHLRTRPAELYLGASTTRGQLEFFAFYDELVFDSADVVEWIGEVMDAMKWYLAEQRGVALSKL
ncbi:hypothetical protein J3R83DRAFT_11771 [Lanmaoa asiatica]|nr:hypothetical protein J3R83DRAFT_11771 [Lanmaoa asiatica]